MVINYLRPTLHIKTILLLNRIHKEATTTYLIVVYKHLISRLCVSFKCVSERILNEILRHIHAGMIVISLMQRQRNNHLLVELELLISMLHINHSFGESDSFMLLLCIICRQVDSSHCILSIKITETVAP